MKPLIIFYTTLMSSTGGGQHAMSLLARELVARGYEVKLFTRPPFDPQHRYSQWLDKIGVPVSVLLRFEDLKVVHFLSILSGIFFTLPYAFWHRRSLNYSWRAVTSILGTQISKLEKQYITRKLTQTIQGRDKVILQIWGPAGLTPILLEWTKENSVYSIYHEMGEADEQYVKTWHLESTVEAINKAQTVICCSRLVADCIRRVYGYEGKIATIPFMIQDPGAVELKSKSNGGRVNFGAIGRLVPHKRHKDLILALRNLRNENHDVGLVIAGDGPMRDSLKEFACEQKVEDRVIFTGEFEKLEDVMKQFDVFTLTSASESQCMPITESMSYGKPVIASNFGGIPDFVEDGVTGYLVPVGDIERLTECFRSLVENPEARTVMGERGRERYVKFYNPSAVTDAIEGVYSFLQDEYPGTGLKIGYFLEYYATFIVTEILELRKLGADVAVFNAFRPPVESDPMRESLRQESFYFPKQYSGILSALFLSLLRSPKKIFKLARFLQSEKESLRMLILAAYYAKIIRKKRIKHLHGTFGTRTTTLAYVTAKLSGIDYSFTTHAYDVFDENPSLVWKTEKAQFMRTISRYNKRYIEDRYEEINGAKIVVNYLGIDTQKFKKTDAEKNQNPQYHILSVGTLIHQKGHSYLIKACSELKKRGINLTCDIIGGGKLREFFQEEIHKFNLSDRVYLQGDLKNDEVNRHLSDTDIFVLACIDMRGLGEHVDGIPVALMEAMAMGLPVISTPLSGIPELIEDGVSGLLVPERDEVALADALERLIHNAALRDSLGCAARCRIQEHFDIRKNSLTLLKLFSGNNLQN